MDTIPTEQLTRKALVLGRIGLVRSLGRTGIHVALAREAPDVFERFSRYSREFIHLPNLVLDPQKGLDMLLEFGARQSEKPVAFLNGESDVLMFSKYRETLGKYYEIMLAPHQLILDLGDKGRFAKLSTQYDLPVPRTFIPTSRKKMIEAAEAVGYPCVIKPTTQRAWHDDTIIEAIGLRKALLIRNAGELSQFMDKLPEVRGVEMVQQFIPGDDTCHFDCHIYINRSGQPLGQWVGQKMRTYPIHFGQGCYTRYTVEKGMVQICLDTLQQIGYTGAANINVKRHAETGQDYILEINPRFSLWTILSTQCGVNLPLLQYCEAAGINIPQVHPRTEPYRWLWLASDIKAAVAYHKAGELTWSEWVRSFFSEKGKIEHHIFDLNDPLPIIAYACLTVFRYTGRAVRFVLRRLGLMKR